MWWECRASLIICGGLPCGAGTCVLSTGRLEWMVTCASLWTDITHPFRPRCGRTKEGLLWSKSSGFFLQHPSMYVLCWTNNSLGLSDKINVARTLLSWSHVLSETCRTSWSHVLSKTCQTHVSYVLLRIRHVSACHVRHVHFNVAMSVQHKELRILTWCRIASIKLSAQLWTNFQSTFFS